MIAFTFTSCIEKFYPYRKALLYASIWIELDEQEKQRLGKYLERMGYKMDNHICWKNRDGMCFSYSDGHFGVGLEIVEGKY